VHSIHFIHWLLNEHYPVLKKRLYTEGFDCPTEDGKAKLLPLDWKPLAESCNPNFPLTLNTGRTVEQWHTRTKTKEIALLNDLAPEAWVELNPKDATKLKVKSGDRITIGSSRGKVENLIVKVTEVVRESDCFVPFHFSEQLINAVTIADFDPKSFEPNFKQCAVNIYSDSIPNGIKMEETKIAGEIEHQKVEVELSSVKSKIYQNN